MSYNPGFGGGEGAGPGDLIPKGFKKGTINQFTPEMHQNILDMFGLMGKGGDLYKQASGDQSQFAQMEAPAMKQLQEMQGNIASRFSGMGSGARRSSGFTNAMNTASQDFASQLQSKRMDYRNQALKELMSMSGMLLGQRPSEQFMVQNTPKPMSFLKQFALAGMQGASQAGGTAASMSMMRV